MSPTRPILRYHGGKWRLAPWIIGHFPSHRIYVEPFGGAGSVLLQKARTYSEVYNDLDGEVVNLFQVVRDRGDELARLIELTPFSRDEFNLAYQESPDPMERARRTMVKAFMGFGSAAVTQDSPSSPGAGFKPSTGFRSDTKRAFTSPAHDWYNYPGAIPLLIARLRGVVIENRPATKLIATHDSPETLFYADPPYVHGTRDLRKHRTPQSYRFEMSDVDHADLAECLRACEGMVVLSGYPCELYDRLYEGWQCVEKEAFADGARSRTECLWLNPACQAALGESGLFAVPS